MVSPSTIRTVTAALALALGIGAVTTAGAAPGPAVVRPGSAVTFTPGPVLTDLYPGTTRGDLVVEVVNPHPHAIRLTSLTASSVASSDETICPAAVVTIESGPSFDHRVPTGPTKHLRLADVVHMSADAPDGCQGVTFTFALVAETGPVPA